MKRMNLLLGLAALLAVLNLPGCIVVPDEDGYRHEYRHHYEHDYYYDRDGRRDGRSCHDWPNGCGYRDRD